MKSVQHILAVFGPADMTILIVVSVLLLGIVWQIVTRVLHKRALAKWQRDLFYAMARGLELELTARPHIHECSTAALKWKVDAKIWITQTGTMLQRYSAQAGISFRCSPEPGRLRIRGIGEPPEYKALLARLRNLRRIIEHGNAYL